MKVIKMIFKDDKIIFCKNPKVIEKTVKKYITENFSKILPFEVHPGEAWQIRFSIDEYKNLSESVKSILQKHVSKRERDSYFGNTFDEMEERYAIDFFWTGANAYIFDYKSINSLVIEIKCEYGYEGLEESESIHFIDESEFPPEIIRNIEKKETDKWKD